MVGGAPIVAVQILSLVVGNVTSEEGRKLNLLEYIESREDLDSSDKSAWDREVRLRFGGKAMRDGSDEGVTGAKSVISAAIFHGVEPKAAVQAAYDTYRDIARWVPPPIAINYQVLGFQGRKPKATAQ